MLELEQYVPQAYRKNSYDLFIYVKLLDLIFESGLLKASKQQYVAQSMKSEDTCVNNNFEEKIQKYPRLSEQWKRAIRRSYYDISYWRGTEKGIELALGLYKHLTEAIEVTYVITQRDENNINSPYSVTITVYGNLYTSLMDCLMGLVLPPSVDVSYLRVINSISDTSGYSTVQTEVKIQKDTILDNTMLSFGSWDSVGKQELFKLETIPQPFPQDKNKTKINPIIKTHTAGQIMNRGDITNTRGGTTI